MMYILIITILISLIGLAAVMFAAIWWDKIERWQFNTVRIVRKNLGKGGWDFFSLQTRNWYWPFWTEVAWCTELEAIEDRFYKLTNLKEPTFEVIRKYPE